MLATNIPRARLFSSARQVVEPQFPWNARIQHDEISHVVWKLGVGRAAMVWERLLDEKTPSDADVAALNAMCKV